MAACKFISATFSMSNTAMIFEKPIVYKLLGLVGVQLQIKWHMAPALLVGSHPTRNTVNTCEGNKCQIYWWANL